MHDLHGGHDFSRLSIYPPERPSPEADPLRPASPGPGGLGESEAPAGVRAVLAAPGQPLDRSTRAFMEPRFGHDFSQVRIHADAMAATSAAAVSARAHTVGRYVVLGAGQPGPESQAGRLLLAHELAHVVQ